MPRAIPKPACASAMCSDCKCVHETVPACCWAISFGIGYISFSLRGFLQRWLQTSRDFVLKSWIGFGCVNKQIIIKWFIRFRLRPRNLCTRDLESQVAHQQNRIIRVHRCGGSRTIHRMYLQMLVGFRCGLTPSRAARVIHAHVTLRFSLRWDGVLYVTLCTTQHSSVCTLQCRRRVFARVRFPSRSLVILTYVT